MNIRLLGNARDSFAGGRNSGVRKLVEVKRGGLAIFRSRDRSQDWLSYAAHVVVTLHDPIQHGYHISTQHLLELALGTNQDGASRKKSEIFRRGRLRNTGRSGLRKWGLKQFFE